VFLHGLTNSPQQFDRLSQRFTARGYSVLVPRMPYHGYLDRMTADHARLTAASLIDTVAEAIDLAAGLGGEVSAAGISLGGILTTWVAQCRAVTVAAPIAPSLGLRVLPYPATGAVFGVLGRLPNRFVWWDPRYKDALPGPPYAYPRFSTHALVETQRLGIDLMNAARRSPPRAQHIWLISNAADLAVSNAAGTLLVKRWRATGATNVHQFEFPRRLKLFHDIVDPLQPGAQPELVHPILEQLIVDSVAPDPSSIGQPHVISA
jgi:alpha-beta hydrolase superfamily lysophospholipase